MPETGKIYVAGHRGMVGGAILRQIEARGTEIVTRAHAELDLTDQLAVRGFFRKEKTEAVILAAAKVGGIHANNAYRRRGPRRANCRSGEHIRQTRSAWRWSSRRMRK